MTFIFGDVLTQAEVIRGGGNNLRAQSAVVFTPVYPENSVSQVSDETLDRLSLSISDGNAYSAIVNNLGINNPDEFDGVTTIAIVGQ